MTSISGNGPHFLEYPDGNSNNNPTGMQIWNNAAFDNGESEDSEAMLMKSSSSWWTKSLDSDCSSKENLGPVMETANANSPASSAAAVKPLRKNTTIANSQGHGMKSNGKKKKIGRDEEEKEKEKEKDRDERKIDMEIEEVEKEIGRLSSRLDALRLEKAELKLKKAIEKRGRIVPSKFKEQKQSVAKIEEDPSVPSANKAKINRRGVSLGPAEIFSSTRARLPGKQDTTPVSTQNNRRKSCFWKLEEIDELKVIKEKGKSLSVSPRSRKTVTKAQASKQAVTTVGSKRPGKKEEGLLALIQPKNLFKDGEKSVPSKKPVKPGRVVASRYNNLTKSETRKRSLPDSDKEDGNKRRASRGNGVMSQRMESGKVKKRWEIPSEIVVYKGGDSGEEESPPSASVLAADVLPKIRNLRCVNDTPRDSGAAKRVADLVGKKSYFGPDDEDGEAAGDSVCQALCFEELSAVEE